MRIGKVIGEYPHPHLSPLPAYAKDLADRPDYAEASEGSPSRARKREGIKMALGIDIFTTFARKKGEIHHKCTNLWRITRMEKKIFFTLISRIEANFTKEKFPLTFPPQAGGNRREGDIDCVIANEVKQSHKSKFRLLSRFTPRNDIDEFN